MSKSGADTILYVLCCALVGATAAVRIGILEYSQFLTLLLAGLTIGITVVKSINDDDDEGKDK